MGTSGWITLYNPEPLKVSSITITTFSGWNTSAGYFAITHGKVLCSNDNLNWVELTEFYSDVSAYGAQFNIPVNAELYYKYVKIQCLGVNRTYQNVGWCVGEITLNATYLAGPDYAIYSLPDPVPHKRLIKAWEPK